MLVWVVIVYANACQVSRESVRDFIVDGESEKRDPCCF